MNGYQNRMDTSLFWCGGASTSRDAGAPCPHSLRGCQSVRPNAPPGRCGNLSPVVHTEDLTVRFGGLPTLNQVNSEASETKLLALDVIAPLTR